MLTSDLMRTMPTFINYKKQDTTEEYYERNKATDVVMTFVRTSNKAFGEKHMEGFARDFLRFKKKKSTEHDHVMEDSTIRHRRNIQLSTYCSFTRLGFFTFKFIRF